MGYQYLLGEVRTECNLQLCTSQPFSDAFMHAMAEPELGPWSAVDIEFIWVFKDVFVSVGRLVQGDDAFACFYKLIVQH